MALPGRFARAALVALLGLVGLAVALCVPAVGQDGLPKFEQIVLSDRLVEAFLSADRPLAEIVAQLPISIDQPAVLAKMEATAQKFGFVSMAEFVSVQQNIAFVVDGFDGADDPQYEDPKDQILRGFDEALKDGSLTPEQRDKLLQDKARALARGPALKFKDNVAIVTKYWAQLVAASKSR